MIVNVFQTALQVLSKTLKRIVVISVQALAMNVSQARNAQVVLINKPFKMEVAQKSVTRELTITVEFANNAQIVALHAKVLHNALDAQMDLF